MKKDTPEKSKMAMDDVKLGEGLELGAVHRYHEKQDVRQAVEDKTAQKKAHGYNERSQTGGANPCAYPKC